MSKLGKFGQKLSQVPWNDFLFAITPVCLTWPACKITLRVVEGILEEEKEWSRRREQYAEEARRAWANGVDLDEARGSFWETLLSDGGSRR